MAAKGSIAKENIAKKLKEIFGSDYIGEYDRKHYIWAEDGGEKVQIAIAMTCPKNPVGVVGSGGALDFEGVPTLGPSGFDPAEITPEEEEKVQNLMKKLGF